MHTSTSWLLTPVTVGLATCVCFVIADSSHILFRYVRILPDIWLQCQFFLLCEHFSWFLTVLLREYFFSDCWLQWYFVLPMRIFLHCWLQSHFVLLRAHCFWLLNLVTVCLARCALFFWLLTPVTFCFAKAHFLHCWLQSHFVLLRAHYFWLLNLVTACLARCALFLIAEFCGQFFLLCTHFAWWLNPVIICLAACTYFRIVTLCFATWAFSPLQGAHFSDYCLATSTPPRPSTHHTHSRLSVMCLAEIELTFVKWMDAPSIDLFSTPPQDRWDDHH